jgi:hypothetical protein
MEFASIGTSSFPVAYCATCDKTVLTWINLDHSGAEIRACVHCDGEVGPGLEWLAQSELEESGYYVGQRPKQKGGCGSGGCSCSKSKP